MPGPISLLRGNSALLLTRGLSFSVSVDFASYLHFSFVLTSVTLLSSPGTLVHSNIPQSLPLFLFLLPLVASYRRAFAPHVLVILAVLDVFASN